MECDRLKREFGDKVIFHGGVDNQTVLPNGTAQDVIAETQACMETLGHGGGYICCSCHNAQAGTPVENILAMIETAKKGIQL
jgi:uroporphyrinogen decarboxylase